MENREQEQSTEEVIRYGRTLVMVLGGIEYLLPRADWFERLQLRPAEGTAANI